MQRSSTVCVWPGSGRTRAYEGMGCTRMTHITCYRHTHINVHTPQTHTCVRTYHTHSNIPCAHTGTQTHPQHTQTHTHMHTTHIYRYTNTYHTLYTCLFHTHRHYVYHMHAQTPHSHRDTPHTLQEASAYRAAKMLPHDSLRSGLCRGTKTILLVIAFCPQVNLWPEQIRGHCHSTEIAIMTS